MSVIHNFIGGMMMMAFVMGLLFNMAFAAGSARGIDRAKRWAFTGLWIFVAFPVVVGLVRMLP